MHSGRRKRFLTLAAGFAAMALVAAGCGSSSGPSGNTVVKGGTVTVGQINGAIPNWIWPYAPIADYSVPNSQDFEWLLYRPLYMFGNNGNSTTVNYSLSPADAPVYSDGGRTVTIQMKGWKWSDGESVDATDVAFWLNMMKAEKSQYAGYAPGTLPDNLVSYTITGADTIVLHLTRAYASTWFTYNQLAEITPMPLAWDITALGAKPGSGGCSTSAAKCAAVFNFLTTQSKAVTTYATSPVWGVVDGPWKLTAFNVNGNDTFVPNKSYSGSPKPHVSQMDYVPYTSDTTEYTALRTGTLDVAAVGVGVPPQDLPQKPAGASLPATNPLASSGYNLEPFYSYAIAYAEVDFQNPTYGPMFKQLYFRQAMAYVDDQEGMVKDVYSGYAYPTTGPVPPKPANPFEPTVETANGGAGPYPFSVSKAVSLLTSHGWSMVGGVMTCQDPAKCGPGIKKGLAAKFTLDYTTGFSTLADQVQIYKSDAAKAGIAISLDGESFNTLLGTINNKNTTWQMGEISGWAYDGPGFLPTGEPLFETNASSNSGNYSNTEMNSLISQVESNSSMALFHQYGTFTADQLPFIWMPQSYFIQAVKKTLHGVTFNPLYTFTPEYWYFTK